MPQHCLQKATQAFQILFQKLWAEFQLTAGASSELPPQLHRLDRVHEGGIDKAQTWALSICGQDVKKSNQTNKQKKHKIELESAEITSFSHSGSSNQ